MYVQESSNLKDFLIIILFSYKIEDNLNFISVVLPSVVLAVGAK